MDLAELTEAYRKIRAAERTVLLSESDAWAMPILDTMPGINAKLHPGVPERTAYLIAPPAQPEIITGPVFSFDADPPDELPEEIRRYLERQVKKQRIVKVVFD